MLRIRSLSKAELGLALSEAEGKRDQATIKQTTKEKKAVHGFGFAQPTCCATLALRFYCH